MTGISDLVYANSTNDVSISGYVIKDILIKFGDSSYIKSQILIKFVDSKYVKNQDFL